MSQHVKTILLDFATITDPTALLQSLILYRGTHARVAVRGASLEYETAIGPYDLYCDLRDVDAAGEAARICGHGADDIRLQSSNFTLAVQVLQHALKEKLIDVIDEGTVRTADASIVREVPAFERVDQYLKIGFDYAHGYIALKSGIPDVLGDLQVCLGNYWDCSINGGKFDSTSFIAGERAHIVKDGSMKEVLAAIQLDTLGDVFHVIDRPTLFRRTIEAVKEVSEEAEYKKQVKWYLPKLVLDKATLGMAGHLEMLWMILRRNKQKNDEA